MSDLLRAPKSKGQAKKNRDDLGPLPEWDLTDLYPGPDSDEVKAALDKARADVEAFEAEFKGKLDGLAREGGLLGSIQRYEEIE